MYYHQILRYQERSSAQRACYCSIQCPPHTPRLLLSRPFRCFFHHLDTSSTTFWGIGEGVRRLTRSTLELLAEHDKLGLVVDGQDTGTGNTTENVGTSTLEERADTLGGDDLASSIHSSLVLDGLTGSHHHATTDGVKRVRSNTSTSGDSPAESEGSQEVTLEGTGKEDRLDRVVHTEVKTTVDDDTSNGGHETTVETADTIRSKGLLVDIDQSIELALSTLLRRLGVVGETGTGVVEGVDEKEGSGTSSLSLLVVALSIVASTLTPPEAKLPIIHLVYPSRSFL